MNDIAREKYVSFTTYKRDGTPVSVPVWIADLDDGRVGFTTSAASWKARRLKNNPNVTLVASDARGKPKQGASEVHGSAIVVTGASAEPIRAEIKKKYGVQVALIRGAAKLQSLVGKGPGTPNDAIIVTL